MIVKRAEQATKCLNEQISWEIAAALFSTPQASRAASSLMGMTGKGDKVRTIELLDSKDKRIGYWRREP
jgi:hypothetical protein